MYLDFKVTTTAEKSVHLKKKFPTNGMPCKHACIIVHVPIMHVLCCCTVVIL